MTTISEKLRSGLHNVDAVVLGGVEHDARCLEAADTIDALVEALERTETWLNRHVPIGTTAATTINGVILAALSKAKAKTRNEKEGE